MFVSSEISTAEHTQSIEALYTFKVFPCFAAGGIRTALSFGGVNCRRQGMPGRPNSRGRLSLNLYTGPPTKHQKRENGRE